MVAAAVVAPPAKARPSQPGAGTASGKARSVRPSGRMASAPPRLQRTPYFCSGCPHNTSTKVPEGSRAMAGIGCHGMALMVPSRRTHDHLAYGRGGRRLDRAGAVHQRSSTCSRISATAPTPIPACWRSRAAAAAGVNITYKILYNDAVAMTGGQPAEGGLTVSQIAHQVWAEGAKRLAIVSDDPEKYPSELFPGWRDHPSPPRARCRAARAARRQGTVGPGLRPDLRGGKRRRRKRGLYPDPPKRVFINERVCEGCGDCSQVSNCVSVQPLETEFGRKRAHRPVELQQGLFLHRGLLPEFCHRAWRYACGKPIAPRPIRRRCSPICRRLRRQGWIAPFNILVTGIGGTGVITIGALLGMAAHVDGRACSTLDFTGLSQKNGAVMSHVRIAPSSDDLDHTSASRPAAPTSSSAATSWLPPAFRR